MNKTAIKNFSIWARNKLIADISYRAGLMGITADGIQSALPQSTGMTEFYDIGTPEPYAISGDAVKQRHHLADLIRAKERETNYKTAYKYVLEEVAYTWFNRLIAVRFMEVNDYLPSHIRVLSSDSGKMEPDLVTTPFDAGLSFTRDEEQKIYQLKQENKIDEAFRILFIRQCNALNGILPALFERTNDYTELLLNLSVIDQDGVVYHLVHDIPEEDFDVERGGQVEIIGWLYQYYNTEPKNEAFAKSGKITKEEIPAVTQLFTPDWIVRYMVENSVGRLWIEHLRALDESADEAALAAGFGWKYYLPEAKQEPEVEEKLRELRKERASLTPEQITMIDPCMGSGHILVYGFSVLMQIYENAGYGQRDAARSILEHNLFGLDIDDRAYQMAYFAVMMKAREYNRRILNGENSCKVYAIQESNGITDAALGDMGAGLDEEDRKIALKEIKALIAEFKDAKEYGSILSIEKRDWNLLRRFAVPNDEFGQLSLDMNGVEAAAERLQELIDIAEVMAKQYMATATNPPYMSGGKMSKKLSEYVNRYYFENKADLFAVFVQQCMQLTKQIGYQTMITQHAWMFLSSFEDLRRRIQIATIVNMVHLGSRAFDEISGEVVQTTSFIIHPDSIDNYVGLYCRLIEPISEKSKEEMFLSGTNRFIANQGDFAVIPGKPIAYWAPESITASFNDGVPLGQISSVTRGLTTGNNDAYLRTWYEVSFNDMSTSSKSVEESVQSKKRWFPHNKGGEFREWYGNNDYVVFFENGGEQLRDYYKINKAVRFTGIEYYFKSGITWSALTTGKNSFRYSDNHIFDSNKGPMLFAEKDIIYYVLGLLNSCLMPVYVSILNPSLSLQNADVNNIPVIISEENNDKVNRIVASNIELAKKDWDAFETSWEFKRHPLVPKRRVESNEMKDKVTSVSPELSPAQLEFAIFCIENLASDLGMNATAVYDLLTKDSDILYGYIIPGYEPLHSQGKDYILEDIKEVMKERGLPI